MTSPDPALPPDVKRLVVRRTYHLLRPVRKLLVLASLGAVLQAAGTLAAPAIIRIGIDQGVRAKDVGALNLAAVAFLVAIAAVYGFGRMTILLVARVGEGFLRSLREMVFDHQMRLSLEFYDRSRTGDLVSRMTADVESLQELVSQGLSMFVVNMLVFFGAIAVMIGMSWQLALGVLVIVPVLVVAARWFRRASNVAYLTLRDRVGGTLSSFQEGIAGVRVVQGFYQEDVFRHKFRETNDRQFRTNLHAEAITARSPRPSSSARGSRSRSSSCSVGTSRAKAPSPSERSRRSSCTSRTSSSRSNR